MDSSFVTYVFKLASIILEKHNLYSDAVDETPSVSPATSSINNSLSHACV